MKGGIVLRTSLAIVLGVVLYDRPPALATQCDCKPEFNVTAEADGTCELTRDDKKWCDIKFNSGTGSKTARQQAFFEKVRKYTDLKIDNIEASGQFFAEPPEKWNSRFVEDYLPVLFAVALWDRAPERMQIVTSILRENSKVLLPSIQNASKKALEVRLGEYLAIISYGCVELTQEEFSVMVKSRFSVATRRCNQWE